MDNELSEPSPINRSLYHYSPSAEACNVWAAGAFNTIKITCSSEEKRWSAVCHPLKIFTSSSSSVVPLDINESTE